MFSWLLDEARANELSTENLTRRILLLNFAGIHMSSSFCIISPFGTHVIYSFTNALYDLASRLDYIEPILQEIEAVLVEEGWSKVAMTRVRKLDISIVFWRSRKGWLVFIPVSTAFVHTFCVSWLGRFGAVSMSHKALKDFTSSDGTCVLKGSFIAVAASCPLDNDVYPDARTFKGFRFSDHKEGQIRWWLLTWTTFLSDLGGMHGGFFQFSSFFVLIKYSHFFFFCIIFWPWPTWNADPILY